MKFGLYLPTVESLFFLVMNDLRFTGFLMLITFVAGIFGFINSVSSSVVSHSPYSINHTKELCFAPGCHLYYAINAGRRENENKMLFPDPGLHSKEIELQISFHSCSRLIKIEESLRTTQVSENRLYRPLHNRAFYCKYQT